MVPGGGGAPWPRHRPVRQGERRQAVADPGLRLVGDLDPARADVDPRVTEQVIRARVTEDLVDARTRVEHVVAGAANAAKFETLAGNYSRLSVGGAAPGWTPFEQAYRHDAAFAPDGPTRVDDPLLLYFTSGTTSRPKLVLHTHRSYPIGHLSTMY